MAALRTRIKIEKSGEGVPFEKFIALSGEVFVFLKSICEDNNIKSDNEKWFALKFENQSISFTIQNTEIIDSETIVKYNNELRIIVENNFKENDVSNGTAISKKTLEQCSHIGKYLGINESLGFGLFNNSKDEPDEWHEFTKQKSDYINKTLEKIEELELSGIFQYYGGISGVIYSWQIETDKPCIKVRNLITGDLINCYYTKEMYTQIHSLTKAKGAYIQVSGMITAHRPDNKIIEITASNLNFGEEYSPDDWEKFLGCAPGLTGKLTAEDYIREIRDDE